MTIRRRVRVALLLMLLVPLFLMAGAFGVARRLGAGTDRIDLFQRRFLAEFNRLVNDDPGSLADPQALAALDRGFEAGPFTAWVVLRDGRELYRSSGMRPAQGSLGGTRWGPRPAMVPAPSLRWDFRFSDGGAGTLLLYAGLPWGGPFQRPGWIFAFIGVLVACNVLLGWWVSSSVVSPLAKLRDAAIRVGEGDLRFSLSREGPDEFGQVTVAFETMREKLQAAVTRQLAEETSRKELIAHVSHDLRTPINLIRGYAEGLRDGVASTPEMRSRYLETILERAGELERLIEMLFSYSTMDLEGARPRLADLELVAYLENLRGALSRVYPDATIGLRVAGGDGVAAQEADRILVRADGELTRRVMANLVENAVTHGGKSRVAVEWTVTPRRAAREIDVAVADDGAGVSAEDLPRIFEPFFRADRARTRRTGGTGAGLGLSIVSRIMQAQGGSVHAAAGPLGGLQVTLTFAEAQNRGQADPDHRG